MPRPSARKTTLVLIVCHPRLIQRHLAQRHANRRLAIRSCLAARFPDDGGFYCGDWFRGHLPLCGL